MKAAQKIRSLLHQSKPVDSAGDNALEATHMLPRLLIIAAAILFCVGTLLGVAYHPPRVHAISIFTTR
jgi:hypothetical protein